LLGRVLLLRLSPLLPQLLLLFLRLLLLLVRLPWLRPFQGGRLAQRGRLVVFLLWL
jgi:hypothetical protein